MIQHEIGHIIRQRRMDLSLKQEDLSEMAGVTTKTIFSIESGKGNTSLTTLQKLLEVLGLELFIQIKKTDE
jgi:y4mF family transcriptional regulator